MKLRDRKASKARTYAPPAPKDAAAGRNYAPSSSDDDLGFIPEKQNEQFRNTAIDSSGDRQNQPKTVTQQEIAALAQRMQVPLPEAQQQFLNAGYRVI